MLSSLLIGLQQGAEQDIFAFFTARRFGMARYGTIYGALIGMSWFGNGLGVIGVGKLHDHFGNYDRAQMIGAAVLGFGAVLIAGVRLLPRGSAESN